MKPQPLVAVSDVVASSSFYSRVLDARSAHGGPDYEQLTVDGELVLQLHALVVDHHHTRIGDPELPLGNGVALWFFTTDLDAAAERVRGVGASIVTDVHDNPNAGHRELWFRDPDGYLVVFAGS